MHIRAIFLVTEGF